MSGLPGVDDLDTYGGEKEDYEPVEDPTTDVSASAWNLIASNVAGMTQTACRAWVAFVGHATTPADPSSNVHGAVWGSSVSVKPTVVKGGTGIYDITWPTEITDELGEEHTVNLRHAWASVYGSTANPIAVTVTGPNTVRLRTFNTSFAANDVAGTTFAVFAI